jgi:hypothetical protein
MGSVFYNTFFKKNQLNQFKIENKYKMIEKINLEKPFMAILTGDYNAKHNYWYAGDITDNFGSATYDIFAKHAITQTVDQPTNITSRTQHCIDLVATDQPNMIYKKLNCSLFTYQLFSSS